MKLISIDKRLLALYCEADEQVLYKDGRPVVLVVKLKNAGSMRDFAVPLRSNISPLAKRDEYFALPNRSNTKPYHHHGLHYTKMMPISKKFYQLYRLDKDAEERRYLAMIDKNEKRIIAECQRYLNDYEAGQRQMFATDLDNLLAVLQSC